MSRVLAYTTTRATTPQRRTLLEATIREGRGRAGYDFEWSVWDYSQDTATCDLLTQLFDEHLISHPYHGANEGQHVAFNHHLRLAHQQGYEYLLRVDDDVEWMSQRWLAKMMEAATKLGPQFILSPTIKGLNMPPEMSQVVDVNGIPCKFMTQAIGGACRLHPLPLLLEAPTPYVSDVRKPLGSGDATGIMKWAKEMTSLGYPVYAVWLDHIRIKHATTTQVATDPTYHSLHDLFQHIPYIPAWNSY